MRVEIEGDKRRAVKAAEALRRIDRPASDDQIDAASELLRLRVKARELQEVSDRE